MRNHKGSILFKLRIILLEIIVLIIVFIIVGIIRKLENDKKQYTIDNPFIISSTEDFVDFANMVQDGYSFKDEYVLMTDDIDLTDIWVPAMGVPNSGHYFEGTFDGGGHKLLNIFSGVDEGDYSLFGTLAGTVMNLGIESGVIQGDTCGSIASHSLDENARIINCYNKALLHGKYVGGIAGNFDGKIINCWTNCTLQGENGYGNLLCYGNSDTINCFSIYKNARGDTHKNSTNYVRFFPDGEKYTSYDQFVPLICDELNNGFHMILAIECPDISVDKYYMWEVSSDGQTIEFSEQKALPEKVDNIRGILYILREYYPFSIIGIVVLVFINIMLLTDGVGKIRFLSQFVDRFR